MKYVITRLRISERGSVALIETDDEPMEAREHRVALTQKTVDAILKAIEKEIDGERLSKEEMKEHKQKKREEAREKAK